MGAGWTATTASPPLGVWGPERIADGLAVEAKGASYRLQRGGSEVQRGTLATLH